MDNHNRRLLQDALDLIDNQQEEADIHEIANLIQSVLDNEPVGSSPPDSQQDTQLQELPARDCQYCSHPPGCGYCDNCWSAKVTIKAFSQCNGTGREGSL